MKVVIQRVDGAEGRLVEAPEQPCVSIGPGLVLYVGFERDDTTALPARAARKIAHLRVFEDGDSLFGRSVLDEQGEILVLFQMPMVADLSRGRRPNFSRAAPPELAQTLFAAFIAALRGEGARVVEGPFRRTLRLTVHNRGPFTLPYQLQVS